MSGVDIFEQFEKLCPAHRGALPAEEKLKIVERQIRAARALSERGHWAYDLNRHAALVELRDVLKTMLSTREEAA